MNFRKKYFVLLICCTALASCFETTKSSVDKEIIRTKMNSQYTTEKSAEPKLVKTDDGLQLSKDHQKNTIYADLDGDGLQESIAIVIDPKNNKSGLRIQYGDSSRPNTYFGLGKDVLEQGFDDVDWAGVFDVAPKNEVYFNNVNEQGDIIGEDEVKDSDKILLKNDAIFIHAQESCGGGIIYLENGKYKWIQQE